jgi:hypothetical protein
LSPRSTRSDEGESIAAMRTGLVAGRSLDGPATSTTTSGEADRFARQIDAKLRPNRPFVRIEARVQVIGPHSASAPADYRSSSGHAPDQARSVPRGPHPFEERGVQAHWQLKVHGRLIRMERKSRAKTLVKIVDPNAVPIANSAAGGMIWLQSGRDLGVRFSCHRAWCPSSPQDSILFLVIRPNKK